MLVKGAGGWSSDWFIVCQAPDTPGFHYLIGSVQVNVSLMAKQ